MKKKLISLALGLSVMAAAVGCSSKPKETEKVTEAKTEVKTEAAAQTEAATEAAVEEAATEAAAAVAEAVSEAAAAAEEAVTEVVAGAQEAVSEAAAVEEAVTEAAAAEEAVTEAAAVEEAVSEAAAVEEAVSEAAAAVEEAVTEAAAAEAETEAVTEAAAAEAETEAVTEAAAAEAETEAVTEAAAAEAETEAVTEAAEAETEAVTEAAAAETETEAVTEAAAVEAETEAVTEAAAAVEEAAEVVTEAAQEQGEGIEEGADAVISAANLADYAKPKTEVVPKETEAAEEETEAAEEAVTEAAEEAVTEAAEEALSESAEEEDLEDLSESATEEEEQKVEFKVELAEEPIRGTVDDFALEDDDVVVLFNNDVHGGVSADKDYSGSSRSLGYAGMAGVKADVEEKAGEVTTVDLGDAIQGSVVTTETDGQAAMDLMEMVDYDILIPGNHEFDYGMDLFLDYANNVSGEFISANFIDNRTGEPIFDSYTLEEYDVNGLPLTVGYVGMTTPETLAKSTPTYFQDEDGNYIYGFDAETPQDLYDDVQEAVDAAYADGADIVIALGHMGDTGVEPAWSSKAVIENTTGISAFLDGHAHSVLPGTVVQNKDGEDVLLASTGTKLEHIGLMKMDVADDGTITISTGLVDRVTDEEKATAEYSDLYDAVQDLEDQFAYLFVVEGTTDFDLVIYDPETEERLIRNSETNLGDFLSDIYLNYFDADAAVLNGGSIRANIDEGEINFMDTITVYPWNTPTGVVEVPGQVILDMLEMGARLYPEECGGWILPAGMTYMIDTTIEPSVNVNSDGEFVSVDGEYRVKNVMIGGEPLDLEKNYRLAINTYYSQEYGDGMTMFKGCKVLVPAEGEDPIIDHDVVVDYIKNTLNGVVPEEYADPYGQGRITIITEENKDLLEEAEEAVTEGALEEAVTEAVTE